MAIDLEIRLSQLTAQLEGLTQQLSHQQVELDQLRAQASLPAPGPLPTNRRRALRRLAGGLIAGLVVAGTGLGEAQAKIVGNPTGVNNQIGALAVPPSNPMPTGTPTGTTRLYGLVGTDGSNIDLSILGTNVYTSGVAGLASNGANGVSGASSGSAAYGVYGYASSNVATDSVYGIYGYTGGAATNRYAGFFSGNVGVSGTLSKSAGSFKIDHPLDPANQYLYHSFVESPDMLNIYNGVVTLDKQGTAVVELPAWFEVLNSDFRYQLTALDRPAPNLHIAQRIKNRAFQIAGGLSGQEVSWQVTGIRQDKWAQAHRIPVEEVKSSQEKGLYLHPELYGQPVEKTVHHPANKLPAKRL